MAFVAESSRLVRTLSRSLSDEVSTSQIAGSVFAVRIPSNKPRDVAITASLSTNNGRSNTTRVAAVRTAVEEEVPLFMLEEAFEKDYVSPESESNGDPAPAKKDSKRKDKAGASTVLSGVKLENISKTYKDATVLKDVSWEVKRGERVGLVGINGAGKTTQLNIIAGKEEPDSGNVVKARPNMKIAFLSQEFEVVGSRTLREEFMSTFATEMDIAARMEKVQVLCFPPCFFLTFFSPKTLGHPHRFQVQGRAF